MGNPKIEEAVKEHLKEVGLGYPNPEVFVKFLRERLTDEELEVILGLPTKIPPFEVEAVDVIAQKLGMDPEKAEKALETLSLKGLTYKKTTDSGKPGYGFIQWAFGFPQVFFWKGEKTAETEKATVLFKFEDASALEKARGSENARSWRYVPVEKAVDYTLQGVLPYEQMTGIIDRSEVIAVVHCPCRMVQEVSGTRECDHTLENCLKFNDMARFVIDKGIGREISKEEAKKIIQKTEEEGLIHFVDNCQEDVHHNCNCCPCCCWNVYPIKNRIVPRDFLMDTYFLRITENEACTSCEACVDSCPLDIITMEEGYPVADQEICIGCGVCLSPCPTGAAKLKRREDKKPPFATFQEIYETEIQEVWKS